MSVRDLRISWETLSIDLHFKPSSFTTKIKIFYQKTAKELLIFQSHLILCFCTSLFALDVSHLVDNPGLKIVYRFAVTSVCNLRIYWVTLFIDLHFKLITGALRYATVLSRCKACLLGDMKAWTSDEHDFISHEKHITEHIAGEIVGRGEQAKSSREKVTGGP